MFHTYLVANNRTTYEHFRSGTGSTVNPYDLGLRKNCFEVALPADRCITQRFATPAFLFLSCLDA